MKKLWLGMMIAGLVTVVQAEIPLQIDSVELMPFICEDQGSEATVALFPKGGKEPYRFSKDGKTFQDDNTFTVLNETPSEVEFTIKDANNDTITVKVDTGPIASSDTSNVEKIKYDPDSSTGTLTVQGVSNFLVIDQSLSAKLIIDGNEIGPAFAVFDLNDFDFSFLGLGPGQYRLEITANDASLPAQCRSNSFEFFFFSNAINSFLQKKHCS